MFEEYVYGRNPQAKADAKEAAPRAKVLFEDANAFGGAGTLKEVELTLGPPGVAERSICSSPRRTTLRRRPASWGRTLAATTCCSTTSGSACRRRGCLIATRASSSTRATDAGRGAQADSWPLAEIVKRGYAVATFYCGDIQPDRPDVREGMRATLPEQPADNAETATIMWWAWGLHRAIDYLVNDPAIDSKRLRWWAIRVWAKRRCWGARSTSASR